MRQHELSPRLSRYIKPDDGPERDFGALSFLDHKLFFKIDAYDRDLEYGSPDPADASVTVRVMTIMLAIEY